MTTDETLRARVVQLEAALRPVAALLDGYDGHGTLRDGQWCEAMLRMGDVRRACAALSGTPAPSPAIVDAVKAGIDAALEVVRPDHDPVESMIYPNVEERIRALSPDDIARRIGGGR